MMNTEDLIGELYAYLNSPQTPSTPTSTLNPTSGTPNNPSRTSNNPSGIPNQPPEPSNHPLGSPRNSSEPPQQFSEPKTPNTPSSVNPPGLNPAKQYQDLSNNLPPGLNNGNYSSSPKRNPSNSPPFVLRPSSSQSLYSTEGRSPVSPRHSSFAPRTALVNDLRPRGSLDIPGLRLGFNEGLNSNPEYSKLVNSSSNPLNYISRSPQQPYYTTSASPKTSLSTSSSIYSSSSMLQGVIEGEADGGAVGGPEGGNGGGAKRKLESGFSDVGASKILKCKEEVEEPIEHTGGPTSSGGLTTSSPSTLDLQSYSSNLKMEQGIKMEPDEFKNESMMENGETPGSAETKKARIRGALEASGMAGNLTPDDIQTLKKLSEIAKSRVLSQQQKSQAVSSLIQSNPNVGRLLVKLKSERIANRSDYQRASGLQDQRTSGLQDQRNSVLQDEQNPGGLNPQRMNSPPYSNGNFQSNETNSSWNLQYQQQEQQHHAQQQQQQQQQQQHQQPNMIDGGGMTDIRKTYNRYTPTYHLPVSQTPWAGRGPFMADTMVVQGPEMLDPIQARLDSSRGRVGPHGLHMGMGYGMNSPRAPYHIDKYQDMRGLPVHDHPRSMYVHRQTGMYMDHPGGPIGPGIQHGFIPSGPGYMNQGHFGPGIGPGSPSGPGMGHPGSRMGLNGPGGTGMGPGVPGAMMGPGLGSPVSMSHCGTGVPVNSRGFRGGGGGQPYYNPNLEKEIPTSTPVNESPQLRARLSGRTLPDYMQNRPSYTGAPRTSFPGFPSDIPHGGQDRNSFDRPSLGLDRSSIPVERTESEQRTSFPSGQPFQIKPPFIETFSRTQSDPNDTQADNLFQELEKFPFSETPEDFGSEDFNNELFCAGPVEDSWKTTVTEKRLTYLDRLEKSLELAGVGQQSEVKTMASTIESDAFNAATTEEMYEEILISTLARYIPDNSAVTPDSTTRLDLGTSAPSSTTRQESGLNIPSSSSDLPHQDKPPMVSQDQSRRLSQDRSRRLSQEPSRGLSQDPSLRISQDSSQRFQQDSSQRLNQDQSRTSGSLNSPGFWSQNLNKSQNHFQNATTLQNFQEKMDKYDVPNSQSFPSPSVLKYDTVTKFSASGVIVNRGGSHLAANTLNSETKTTGNPPNSVDSGIGSPRSLQGPAYSPKISGIQNSSPNIGSSEY